MLMMFGSLGCPAEKRRLADADGVWLLGVPGRNAGLLMLMMFGSMGCPAEPQACSLGCPAETKACECLHRLLMRTWG